MKCEICKKEILSDSQCINYKYYHNDCIEHLQEEKKQLQQKNEQQKEIIDKAVEYINKHIKDDYYCRKSDYLIDNLLQILQDKEVSK